MDVFDKYSLCTANDDELLSMNETNKVSFQCNHCHSVADLDNFHLTRHNRAGNPAALDEQIVQRKQVDSVH